MVVHLGEPHDHPNFFFLEKKKKKKLALTDAKVKTLVLSKIFYKKER
jgi:hypothetical protein